MSKKKRIILHGYLAELYPHPIEVEAETVAEAVRSLEQIPELQPKNGQPHPVQIDGVDSDIALFSPTQMEEIHIHPRTGGAGGLGRGLGQILIGVALIAVGVFAPGLIPTLGGLLSPGSIILMGGMMVLGGILQMLYPVPELGESPEQESSRYLGAGRTTVRIGTNITLAYGNVKLAGHYLSFDVDAKDQAGTSTGLSSGGVAGSYILGDETTISNDPGDVSDAVAENVYQIYDANPVQRAPVNPIYAEPVASPTNIPTSGWVAA